MKRILLMMLVAVLCFGALTACSEEEIEVPGLNDAQAEAVLTELLPKSAPLMELFFGQGLDYIEPESMSEYDGAQYEPVKEGQDYTSISQMKAAMEGVFSSSYKKDLYIMMFEGYDKPKETEEDVEYLDETILPRYIEEEGVLKIDIKYESFKITSSPIATGAKVIRGNATRVVVEVKTTEEGGKEGTMRINLALDEDSGKWLLDGATF